MSKQIMAVHQQPQVLSSLEMVLGNWGYELEKASSVQEMNTRLRKVKPHFLLIENGLISSEQLDNLPLLARETKSKDLTIALLGHGSHEGNISANYALDLPLNIFALYEAVQKSLEPVPRQDVRVKVRLPGMVRPGDKHFNLGEVLCLSTGGMFIRCGIPLPTGTQLEIILPLLGLKCELELAGEVIYQVTPCAENNYNQGVGIRFNALSIHDKELLEKYLENRLQEDLYEHLGQSTYSDEPLFVWRPQNEINSESA